MFLKRFLFLLSMCLALGATAQVPKSIITDILKTKDCYINNKLVNFIMTDTALVGATDNMIPTARAVKIYVMNHSGGGSGGSADDWGTQVVQHDATLIGDGTTGNELGWVGGFVNSPLTGSGTSLVPFGVAANSITASHLAANSVANSEMADDAIGTAEITNGTVANSDLANMATLTLKGNNTGSTGPPLDLTVAQVKTQLNLTGTNSGDQTITLTGDVTGSGTGSFAATIASNAVGSAEVTDGTIANADLATVATATFKGRTTAGTGAPEDLSVAQAKTLLNLTGTNSGDQTITLTGDVTGSGTGSFAATVADNSVDGTDIALGSDAQGDVMYYNGTDWARLAPGTAGQFLQTGGAAANPAWANGAGGSDNWGAQVVEHDATLTGTGVTGNLLGIPDNAITNAKMADNAIGSAEITDGTVGLGDLANMATASVYYRKTAGSGAPEVQSLAQLKVDLGLANSNSGDQTITLTGDVTGSGTGSFTATVADNSVDGTDIAFGSDALGDSYYYDGTNVVRLAGNTTAVKLYKTQTGNGTVSAAPAWAAIAAADLPTTAGDITGLVTNLQIGSGVVGSAEIADASVGLGDLANMATASVYYRKTAGSGAPEVQSLATLKTDLGLTGTNSGDQTITLTGDVTGSGTGSFAATVADNSVDGTDIALGSDAQGDVMYYNGTDWARLAPGTAGQFLQTGGAAANPVWANGAGGSDNWGSQVVQHDATLTGTGVTGNLLGIPDNAITNAKMADDAIGSAEIVNGSVALADLATMATSSVYYRTTAGTGAPEVQSLATLKTDLGLTGTNSGDQTITLTGDVTGSGTGSFAATIASNAVGSAEVTDGTIANADLATVATATFKGRTTAGTGAPEDLSVAQAKTLLNLTGTNSGDQTITLTGDVTGSGTGSFAATIADNSVDGTDIALGSDAQGDVMYYNGTDWARLAPGTAGQVLQTGGAAANPAWASAAGGDVTGPLSNLQIGSGAVGSAEISDGTVGLGDLATMATASVYYRKTAGSGAPEVQSLATLKTDLGLTGTNSGDQTITLTGDVTGSGTGSFAATIASNAVGSAEVTDGTIANADLATVATATFKGRTTAGTGAPEDLSVAQAKTLLNLTGTNSGDQTITLTGDVTGSGTGSFAATVADNSVDGTDIALGSDAQGDVMYYNGTDWARLAPGTSGQFLKTNGPAANPAWANGGSSPTGTDKQTLYYSGTTLTATSQIQTDGATVGIGTAPTSIELSVGGGVDIAGAFSTSAAGNVQSSGLSASSHYFNTTSGLEWAHGSANNGNWEMYEGSTIRQYIVDGSDEFFHKGSATVGNATKSVTAVFGVVDSITTGHVVSLVENKMNTSSAHAVQEVRVASGSAGDAWTRWTNGTTTFSVGLENTTDHQYFSRSTDLGTNDWMIVSGTTGTIAIGGIAPTTANLAITAGTTTNAPLRFTTGTNTTTPVNGSVEFDGTNFFGTASTTRYTMAKVLTGSATINFPSTAAGDYQVSNITVTGAADGDPVTLGVPNTSVPINSVTTFFAWVSAANTVTVKFLNLGDSTLDPNSGTFKAYVTKY